jgi:N-acetylmuramoyl-L-alanine amidase CwlA
METKRMYIDAGHPNRPGTKIKVTGVVVHWTANEGKGADAIANRNYFNRKPTANFAHASAHLNVDDTRLVECLPWKKGEAEMGYHVGASKYMSGIQTKLGNSYPNAATIGLEICVNSDGDFSKAYANAIKVTAMMLKEHGLGLDDMHRHYDVTGKLCPGFHTQDSYAKKYLNTTASVAWAAFKQAVAEELNPAPAPQYYKVYIDGALYKYQFATSDAAEECAKYLYKLNGGTNKTIRATSPDGTTIYTPHLHPEDFPEYEVKPDPIKEEETVGNNLPEVPSWAASAVKKALAKKIISDSVGTQDFYRLLVILDNLKLLG